MLRSFFWGRDWGTFVIGADAQFNWRVSVLYPFGDNLRDKKDTNRRRKEFTLFTKDTKKKKKKKMKSFFSFVQAAASAVTPKSNR